MGDDLALVHMRAQARNNAWANLRLLDMVGRLTQAEFVAPRTSFFPSLRATLNHILIIDHFYVDALEGGTLGPAAWADLEPCADIAALRAAQAEVDARLIRFCDALTMTTLLGETRVHRGHRVQVERTDRVLLHLFQHDIHHRGQAHAMLSGTDVKPPQLDEFYPAGEAHLRTDEFARLGFTEAAIWGDPPA